MKKITIVIMFLLLGCATSSNTAQGLASSLDIPTEAKPESFAHCMRYDEVVILTAKEELELLEYCLGL